MSSRTIQIAALNIAMNPPHARERYIQLFVRAYRRRQIIRLGSLHGAMIGSLYGQRHPDATVLTGEFYRFVRLDLDEPWFNSQTQAPATDEEADAISIPSHLLPHLQRIPFEFRVRRHWLFYVAHDRKSHMSALFATRFLQRLLEATADDLGFPAVEVTALPEAGAIDTLLAIPRLSRLEIELKPPNADDADDLEQELLRRLEAQRAKKLVSTLVAKRNETLVPDEETQALARVAARNGKVTVFGRDAEDLPIQDSTVDRPLLRAARVDDDLETTAQVLNRVVDEETP
jgi:hypothetical protein